MSTDNEVVADRPVYSPSKYGHDRTGSCGCGWSYKLHGNICPEHGVPALTIDKLKPVMLQQILFLTANEINEDGWLKQSGGKYAWFVNGYYYASTQTRAIPALAACKPEDLYFAVCAIMRANNISIPDERKENE